MRYTNSLFKLKENRLKAEQEEKDRKKRELAELEAKKNKEKKVFFF